MSFWGTVLSTVGLGTDAGVTQPSGYTFDQQQKDFIKLQFKYALLLKQKLANGEITQDYYSSHIWLTTQTLTAPYSGWWTEFKAAIDSEDLNWLSSQVGEDVASLTKYMGKAIGTVAASVISGTTEGLATGFFGGLNIYGYLAIAGLGVAAWYGWKKGLIQKAFKVAVKL